MISDKDIIVELLRQREELRAELAASTDEPLRAVERETGDLHAQLDILRQENKDLRYWNEKPIEYRFKHKGMDYLVVNVEGHTLDLLNHIDKLIAERDGLKKQRDELTAKMQLGIKWFCKPDSSEWENTQDNQAKQTLTGQTIESSKPMPGYGPNK